MGNKFVWVWKSKRERNRGKMDGEEEEELATKYEQQLTHDLEPQFDLN